MDDDFYYTYQPKDSEIEESEPQERNGFDSEPGSYKSAKQDNHKKQSRKQDLFEWLDVLVTSVITVVVIFSFIFRIATVEGPSMEKTFYTNDKVIITNLGYTPKQGDVVVISRNVDNSTVSATKKTEPIIKRVIAVAGQTVDIDFITGVVSVDGIKLDEPYANTPTNLHYDVNFPVTVPEGCIFVLGDNRNNSLDSRSSMIGNNGMIDKRYVLGRAVLQVYPFTEIGGIK